MTRSARLYYRTLVGGLAGLAIGSAAIGQDSPNPTLRAPTVPAPEKVPVEVVFWPSTLPRNANNIYPFEVSFDTTQQSIREESVQPSVLVGAASYPMKPTPMLKGRWEAYVPVPAKTNFVYYRYKFDYLYDRIPEPGRGSRLSPTYQLEIVDE